MATQRSRSGSTVSFREQPAPDRSQLTPTPASDASSSAPTRMGRRRASTVTFVDRPASFAAASRPALASDEASDSFLKAPPSYGRRRASSSATLFPDEPPLKSLDEDKVADDPPKRASPDLKVTAAEAPTAEEYTTDAYTPARLGRRRASSMTLVAPAPVRPAKYKLRRPSSLTLASTAGTEYAVELLPAFTRGDTSDPPRGSKLSARIRSLWKSKPKTACGGGPEDLRLHHLDSLKLIAALTLLTSTVFTSAAREWPGAATWLYPVRSDFALAVFMTLVGRILPLPWLEPLAAGKSATPSHETASMRKFGQTLLRRPFRFLPVLVISGLQYAVGRAGGPFATSEPLRQLFGGVAELPQWTLPSFKSWAGVATSLFVASDMSVYLRSTTSVLYITPWLLQGSLYVLGVATFSGLFKNSSRQALFIFLAAVNWTTYSFLTPFMLGLILADLSVCGTLARISAGGRSEQGVRMGVQCAVAALLVVFLFVAPLREGISDGLAHVQVLHGTQGDPLTSGYQLLRFSDIVSAALLVLLAEVAWPVRAILSFRPLAAFGRFGAGAVAISHPLVLFYLVPYLYQPTSDAVDHSAGSVLAHVWGLTLALSIAAAPLVAILAELPSQWLARLCVRFFLPDISDPAPPEPARQDSPAVVLVAPPPPMALRNSLAPTLFEPSSPLRKDSGSFASSTYKSDSPQSFAPTLYNYSPRKGSVAPTLYGDSPRKDMFASSLYGDRKDSFAPTQYGDSPHKDTFASSLYGDRRDSLAPTLFPPPSPMRRDSLALPLYPPPSPLRRTSVALPPVHPPSPLGPAKDGTGSPE